MHFLELPEDSPSFTPQEVDRLNLIISSGDVIPLDRIVIGSRRVHEGPFNLTRPSYSIFASLKLLSRAFVENNPFKPLYSVVTLWNESTFNEMSRVRKPNFWDSIGSELDKNGQFRFWTLGELYNFTEIGRGSINSDYGKVPYFLFEFIAKNGLIIPSGGEFFNKIANIGTNVQYNN